jgi:trimeric autotransporter adhesin
MRIRYSVSAPLFSAPFIYLAILLTGMFVACLPVSAVTPLPVPSIPPLNASTGRAMERLLDGSMIVGGDFTYVNGTPVSYVAKFDANGNLMPNWRPEPNDRVFALVSTGEYLYIAGPFQSIGGQGIARLARVRIDNGEIDPLWAPVINAPVSHLALDGSGGLIVAGGFSTIDGVSRTRLARIVIETGSLDPTWQHTLSLDSPTALLVAGDSLFVADQGNIYKLATATGFRDSTWSVNDPNAGSIRTLAEYQGSLYLGGLFTQIKVGGGLPVTRNRLARVSLTAPFSLDATWNPNIDGAVNALAFDVNDFAYIVGEFTTVGGAARGQIAKVSTTGSGSAAPLFLFDNTMYRQFYDVLVTQTQLYVAGGQYLLDFGVPDRRFGMAAFSLSNAQLSSRVYDLGVPGKVNAVSRQPDGAYIVVGSFQKAGTRERQNIFRQLSTGELDLGWNPAASAEVTAVAANDTSVFVGGHFSRIGGVSRSSLAKIDSFGLGTIDAAWIPDVIGNFGFPQVMKIDESRQFVVVGLAQGLLRIPTSGNGQPDPTWNALTNSSIVTIDIAPDGMVYAGGDGGSPGNHLRRYFPTASGPSSQDGTWHPTPSNPIWAVHVGADGWIYVGGEFSSIGQQLRSLVARVSSAGQGLSDPVWNPQGNIGTSQSVRGIALDSSGFVYLGGTFTTIGGQSASSLARVSAAGAGALEQDWRPDLSGGYVNSLQIYNNELAVTGQFASVDGALRLGAMALPLGTGPDAVFGDGFE